jgi:CDP-paratose synthetase
MKVLLTGATGFLGRHILQSLLQKHHRVIIAKRRETDFSRLAQEFGDIESWNIEEDGLEEFFRVHLDLDAIIHSATSYGRVQSIPTETFWANEAFPLKILECSIKHEVPMFINIDTFFNSKAVNYEHLGAYSLSKRHFQEWGQHLGDRGLINFINLRMFHLYGPGDGVEKFVPNIVRRCLAGENIELTDGFQKRDFIYVSDAVSALNIVLEAESNFRAGFHHYDIGTGWSISIRDFVEKINEICSSGAKLNFGALPTRKGEFVDSCADTSPLAKLGWSPQCDIENGIKKIINDTKSN